MGEIQVPGGIAAAGAASKAIPGLGGKLLGLLSGSNPITAGIFGGLQLGQMIAPLFRKSLEGKQKENATSMQQSVEKTAQNLYNQVLKGTLAPEVAISALKNLGMVSGGGTSNMYQQAGGTTANAVVQQVIANLQELYGHALTQPVSGIEDRLGGSPQFQKDRLKTLLMNQGAGTQLGKEFGEMGGAFGKILQPRESVESKLPQFKTQYEQMFPDKTDYAGIQSLGDRLKKQLAKYQGG